jgi:hypothetical protein
MYYYCFDLARYFYFLPRGPSPSARTISFLLRSSAFGSSTELLFLDSVLFAGRLFSAELLIVGSHTVLYFFAAMPTARLRQDKVISAEMPSSAAARYLLPCRDLLLECVTKLSIFSVSICQY